MEKLAIAMSGGVDSSVALVLLRINMRSAAIR